MLYDKTFSQRFDLVLVWFRLDKTFLKRCRNIILKRIFDDFKWLYHNVINTFLKRM